MDKCDYCSNSDGSKLINYHGNTGLKDNADVNSYAYRSVAYFGFEVLFSSCSLVNSSHSSSESSSEIPFSAAIL